jgi:hypothetical protein
MSGPRRTEILENFISDGVKTNIYELDSFGRGRVGLPHTQYEYDFQYNKAPLIWNEKVTGTGAATHLPNESSIELSTGGTADTAGVIRQTKSYFRYRPGKSLEFEMTFAFGDIQTNVIKRLGYHDANDGIYFEQNGTDSIYYLAVRTSTSGSPLDTEKIVQASWNIDPLDGTGPSKITADFTKTHIFTVTFQWLGVGSVVCGFNIDGAFIPVHRFNHANTFTTVYMKTANLPVRYEIFNSGIATETGTMKQICATLITNGGIDPEFAYVHSFDPIVKTSIGTTYTNIVNIRPKATFNSITNRGQIKPVRVEVNNIGSGTVFWQLLYNPTLGGTPSYTSVGANSITEYDTAGTTVTGGEVIDSGTLLSTNQSKSTQSAAVGALYPLTLDIDGANPTNLCLVVKAATGTVDVAVNITFNEIY